MYSWTDHTAELELEIEAGSERAVLAESLAALAELLGGGDAAGEGSREVSACGRDRPALLAAWLEELVFLAESEGFVATRLVDLDLRADGLRARVSGVVDDPPPLVKGVTLHRLVFEGARGGYVARVVLDV